MTELTKRQRAKSLRVNSAISFIFMIAGGAIAWGFGGAVFGAGLWIALSCVCDEIKDAIK